MRAQDTTAAATEDDGKFSVTGYIDQYYIHAFNNPQSGNLMGNQAGGVFGGAPAGRAFDRLTDQFALGLVQTKFAYSNKKSDMVIDLTFGPNAELGNFGNQLGGATGFSPANSYQSVLYGSSIAIKQAYWTYKATSKLSFTVGQFGTHIGYEVIDAPVNFHYSLSNLFNNGPFYHVGAKANYAFNDNFGLMVGIVNNWDALTDWKKQKSAVAQLFFKPVDGWNVYLNWIGGHNDDPFKVGSGPGSRVGNTLYNDPTINPLLVAPNGYNRQLYDITTGYQITDNFYLGLNAVYGFYYSGDTTFKSIAKGITKAESGKEKEILPWYGIAGYANYTITDMLAIGARYEHFSDKYGVRYLGATNNSLTITAPITLAAGHLIVKPEFRLDVSPSNWGQTAPDANGATESVYYYEKYKDGKVSSTKSQSTLGVAFIYKY
jgi:hypothetical protein